LVPQANTDLRLEQNFEEFREPQSSPAAEVASADISASSEPARETPTAEPQAPEALPAPPPIPPLPSSFWQALLFGNPDGLIPVCDATGALHLISNKLRIPITQDETIGVLRAGQLRKMLRSRFGARDAERAMSELWRSAASPGVPEVNVDQSHCTPGVWECPRSMPAWRRELNDPVDGEMQWQIENGCWCG
jgi:hypothetical protein